MKRQALARIDLGALRHNLRRVRSCAPDSRVMAVIKAEAYGHGMLPVAQALSDADAFAVSCVEEAQALREAGFAQRIVCLQGVQGSDELMQAARHDIEFTVHQESHLQLLEDSSLPRPVTPWLKIDTGMHRLGFRPERAAELHARLAAMTQVRGPVPVMTHLACADDREDDTTALQVERFDQAITGLDTELSIANSAGVLGWPDTLRDWVRPGIMLYGSSPFLGGRAADDGLRPVMTLSAPLIAVRRLRAGEPIGYGATWACPEDMPVGIAAIGYGDGYPRHAPSGTPVSVNGQRTRLVGRVSMDMVALDLRGIEARVGEPVELWGNQVSVDEVAAHAGTISYQLLCGVAGRCQTEYVDGEA
ncbi:MAG: alanine racemase [Acidihalobacter sp.]